LAPRRSRSPIIADDHVAVKSLVAELTAAGAVVTEV
jgi:hypothetical protein